MFSKEIEIVITFQHNVSNSGVGGGDGDGCVAVGDGDGGGCFVGVAELTKEKICEIFRKENLAITIQVNLKVVNFLDITLDLTTGLYMPYITPNDTPSTILY